MISVVKGLPAGFALVAGAAQAPRGHVALQGPRGDAAELAHLGWCQPGAVECGDAALQVLQSLADRAELPQDRFMEVDLCQLPCASSRNLARLRANVNGGTGNQIRLGALGGHCAPQVVALDVPVVGLFVHRGTVTEGASAEREGLAGLDAADRPAVPQVVQVELGEMGLYDSTSFACATAVAPGVDETLPEGGVVIRGAQPARLTGDRNLIQRESLDPGAGQCEAGS